MAVPSTPQNFWVQTGNQQNYLSWSYVTATPAVTNYIVQRSNDGINFSTITTVVVNSYLDSNPALNTTYYYRVAAVNSDGTGTYTTPQSIVATLPGEMSLGEIRLRAQQEANLQNSNFITMPEWNFYINQSYYELYDLLITTYEDYFVAPRLMFQTDGNQKYDLPNGNNYNSAPALYKLYGVDLGLSNSSNAWVTIKKFDFIQRNRYVFPQITSTFLGVFNLRYRVVGNQIMFIPVPSAGQYIGLWYYPRLTTLLADSDVMDGFSGWTEYVILDAAIKALLKEESDASALMARKEAIKLRIEAAANNRDVGQPDTISDTRTFSERWGSYGAPNGDGSYGGY